MKESDIRDREVLNRYLSLVEDDCKRLLIDKSKLNDIPCPACGRSMCKKQFVKYGFEYVTCNYCQTLFVKNRPNFEALLEFYSHSISTTYWINNFFKPKAENRREMIFRPRARYIVTHFGRDPQWLIGDIGAGFGIFLEEIKKLWPKSRYVAIEPSVNQAKKCEEAQLEVKCCAIEDLKGYKNRFNLLTAFELLEHICDLNRFLDSVFRFLKPGGIFFATTLNGQGFDIQILWKYSKAVFPPHHLNFFNLASIDILLKNHGFQVEEVVTPGKLDWDIVEGMIVNDNVPVDRFWKLVATEGTPAAKQELQEWITKNRFSSHMRVLARKPLQSG